MNYGIASYTSPERLVSITGEKFDEIERAHDALVIILGFEERLNLVLENYAEFEISLLQISLRKALFESENYSAAIDDLHLGNRRVANLLSTCRMYIDQGRRELKELFKNDRSGFEANKRLLSEEYDSCSICQVMDALRNYVQHYDLPSKTLYHNYSAVKRRGMKVCSCDFPTALENFKDDPRAKTKEIRAKLETLFPKKKEINLKMPVRAYVTKFGRIHAKLRVAFKPFVSRWLAMSSEWAKEFEKDEALCLVRQEPGASPEQIYLGNNPLKRLMSLQHKNRLHVDLETLVISSEDMAEKA